MCLGNCPGTANYQNYPGCKSSAFLYYTTTYIPKERALASNALAAALGSASGLHTPNGKSVGQMAERSQSLFKYGLPFN